MKHQNDFSLDEFQSYRCKSGGPSIDLTPVQYKDSQMCVPRPAQKPGVFTKHHSVSVIQRYRCVSRGPWSCGDGLPACLLPATHKTYVHIHLTSDLYTEVGQQGFRERSFLAV